MPVCRFFLENRCRFGENCKFEHPRGGGGGGAQRSLFGSNDNWQGGGGGGGQQRVTFRDSFGGGGQGNSNQYKWVSNQAQQQGQGAAGQQVSALDLVNNFPKELETWEKTKMWPFSCVTLEKDLPCLPEFQDISMEEMRLDAYEAMKTGNLQPYTQKYQSLLNEFQNKRSLLKNMTMDLKQKLISIIEEGRKKKAQQSSSAPSSFGSNSSQNLFGQSENTGASNVFGGTSSDGNLFGKPATASAFDGSSSSGGGLFGSGTSGSAFGSPSSSLFGKPAQGGSVFGGQSPNPSQSPTNLFGMGNQTSSPATTGLFSSQSPSQTGTSVFGGSTQTSQPSSLFGATPSSPPSQGLFGKPSPGLGQGQGTGSLFGSSAPSPQSSTVFGGPPAYSSSLFGNSSSQSQQQQPATLFGKPVADSQSSSSSMGMVGGGISGSSQVDGGLFGKGSSATSSGFTSQSSFGGGATMPASAPSAPSQNSSIFTPLAELTEQEKAAFEAKTFELGKIPLRPPPKELTS